MLEHIALEVVKADITGFYQDIFGGKVNGKFELNAEDSRNIFSIDRSVEITYVTLNQVEFELFVNEKASNTSFNHICLLQPTAKVIYERANKKSYNTYLRKSKKGETYFIKDRNQNLFEIKSPYNI